MPTTTTTKEAELFAALVHEAVKARGGGPGSRGGHPWTDANGNIRYGNQPHQVLPVRGQGQRAVVSRGLSPALRAAAARHRANRVAAATASAKPKAPLSKVQQQHHMLSEMDKVIKTGKDPHGNKLSAANIDKLRYLATSLRTDLKGGGSSSGRDGGRGSHKKEMQPSGGFTVFKDKQGAWRWLSVSSSGFRDNDGETVSTKALAASAARCDALGNYGPLDWWHTPIVLGQCDFNAMHGKLLVESGTFNNSLVAQKIAERIASKEFVPGVSLEFAHNVPGPQVVPGRVFDNIHKYRRALLPAHIASNMASTFQVANPATSNGPVTKEVKKKMDQHKEQRLRELLGPELVDEFLAGTARSEKALELAGVSYKAAAALTAPMDKTLTNAAPLPVAGADDNSKKVAIAKKDDLLDPVEELDPANSGVEGVTDGEDGEDEGNFEDSPADEESDAILESLFTRIGQIVNETVKTKVDEILAAVNGLGQSSTKEVAAMEGIGIALKENANALATLTGENKSLKEQLSALKSRLDMLDGQQPPAVRARASQANGLALSQLNTAHAGLVQKENQSQNPYEGDYAMKMAQQMTRNMAKQS